MDPLRSARVRWKLLMERRGHIKSQKCPTCGSSLSAEWPYLDPTTLKEHKHNIRSWRSGKAAGCDFCSVVTLVIHHAKAQHQLKPDPLDSRQPRRTNNNVDIEVLWGKKFDRFVLTLGYFSTDKYQGRRYTFTVHPTKRNSLLETQSSRLVDRSSPEAMLLIRWWLESCEEEHISCRTSDIFMPSRLLAIADGMIKLQLNIEATKPYVALSHCWGPTNPIMLLEDDLQTFQQGISWADLPRTFQEAIVLTGRLGFEYIWIDTMCIIQDNVLDWEQQSSLMASVYGNAALVLAASSSGSAQDGFLELHDNKPVSDDSGYASETRLRLNRKGRSGRIKRSLDLRLEPPSLDRGPLDDRAWAYQEEAMAKRYLSLGRHEMMWTCAEAVHFESGGRRFTQRTEEVRKVNLTEVFTSITNPFRLRTFWRRIIVRNYGKRKLTNQSDILVALSAVAQAFHSKLNSTYLAGLWKDDLIRGLCWSCPNQSAPRQQYCPSWSWASLSSAGVRYFEYRRELEDDLNLCAAVIEASTSPATINVFGPVSEGLVVIRGPSSTATITLDTEGKVLQVASETVDRIRQEFGHEPPVWKISQDTTLIKTSVTLPDGTMEISARRTAFGEALQAQEDLQAFENITTNVWLLPLQIGRNRRWRTLDMLVLGRNETKPDHFHRLGFLRRPVAIAEEIRIETVREVTLQDMSLGEFVII